MRLFIALLCLSSACSLAENYLDLNGPRYAGDYVVTEPTPRSEWWAVTYNLKFADDVDAAVVALADEPLVQADLLLMQEMDAPSVDRIARERSLRYVYYPGSVQEDGDDWGNAILSRWPIVADRKLLLPHFDPYNHRVRIAVLGELDVGGTHVQVASIHNATPSLGLGARLDQAEATLRALTDAPGPRVVGGDFNTADPGSRDQTVGLAQSYGYFWASEGAGDTAVGWLGSDVLDLVFAHNLSVSDRGVYVKPAGSDHKPVWVRFNWPP